MLSTHNLAGHARNGCLLEIAHRRVYPPLSLQIERWALTPPFHPYLPKAGGFLSVALSVFRIPFLEPKSPSVTRSDCPLVSGLSSPSTPRGEEKGDRSARVSFIGKSGSISSMSIYSNWHKLCNLTVLGSQ